MRVLFAVMKDLWDFVRMETIPFNRVNKVDIAPTGTPLAKLPLHTPPLAIVEPRSLLKLAAPTPVAVLHRDSRREGDLYMASEGVLIHHEPVIAFDNVVGSANYGSMVDVIKRTGRWSEVATVHHRGWVLSEELLTAAEVLPQLLRGKTYDQSNPETVKLRKIIHDSFSGAVAGVPLQDSEYVTYRLWQQGVSISWPMTHARISGSWQRKLRGVSRIKIDVLPRTGSIMEFIIDDVGYLGYVEAVTPDLKISVCGVGLAHEAQYTEQVMPHAVWRELHPVFIQVL